MSHSNKTLHRTALSLMGTYLVALALIVFWPTPVDRPAAGTLTQFISWMHHHGVPHFVGYAQIEFTANIAMFVPMGIIASVWCKTPWVAVAVGAVTSCLIELCQGLFLPHRYASGLDVLANTLGAGIGAAIYYATRRPMVERVGTQDVEPVETPSEQDPAVDPQTVTWES